MAPDRAFVILLIFISQSIRGEEIIAEEEDFLVDDDSNFVRFKRDVQSQVTQSMQYKNFTNFFPIIINCAFSRIIFFLLLLNSRCQ